MPPQRRSALLALLLTAIVAAATLVFISLWNLGRWLVISDPLEPSRAVVVLGGEVPFRAVEAASLFTNGWASEIWLTRDTLPPAAETTLARLNITVRLGHSYNREVLQALGVPSDAIHIVGDRLKNTAGELKAVASELTRIGGGQVIIITSRPHTRRVRATWNALVGPSPRVIVHPSTQDGYDSDRWWRRTEDALAVSREVFGLVNVWAGFPVRSYDE